MSQNALIHQMYIQHNSWLHRWLTKKIGSSVDAADLAQDTFISILHKEDLSFIAEPRAYLTTIAHHLMVNHVRRHKIEQAFLNAIALLSESETPSPETIAISLESLVKIDEMLNGLPSKVRQAFLLSHLEGLSHLEIAERLNISKSCVRKYLAKALAQCVIVNQA
jgi:RNA polymerase sigma-70 factor (ECF subfamily)